MAEDIVARYRTDVEDAINKLKALAGINEKVGTTANKAGQDLNNLGRQAGNLGKELAAAFGIGATIAGFAALVKSSIGTMMNFEAQMSTVRAVSGATAEQFKKLESNAKALGAATKFTATEVGQLQEEYAKLGFTTDEILAATDATLALAAATGTSLADAANVAGATIRGFGLDAEETSRVTDVMALSFSKSALSLSDFAEAMKYVAPIAKVANIDVETTTALLGKLADAGLRGSIAGTSLKNLLTKLADGNSDLSQQLGFSVKNTDDLFKAFKQLQTANIDLTAATELTDERSKAAFITFIDGIDSVKTLKTELDNAKGAAKEMADIMSDNLAGDVKKLESAWEGLILTLSDTDGLRKAAGALTYVLDAMNKTYMSAQEFFEAFDLAENLSKAAERAKEYAKSLSGSETAQDDLTAKIAETKKKIEELEAARVKYNVTEEYSKRKATPWENYRIQVESLKAQIDVYEKALRGVIETENELAEAAPAKVWIDNLENMGIKSKELKDTLEKLPVFTEAWIAKFKELDKVNMRIKAAANLVENLKDELEKPADVQFINVQAEEDALQKFYENSKEWADENEAHMRMLRERRVQEALDALEQEKQAKMKAEADMLQFTEQLQGQFFASLDMASQIAAQKQREAIEMEMSALEDKYERGELSEEQYQLRQTQLRRKAAQQQKDAATFSAAINGANAILQALGNNPPPYSYALAAISGIMTAAQIAAIQSQPLPQFAEGGWVTPEGWIEGRKHYAGGVKLEAEGGEFIVNARQANKYADILEAINRDRFDAEQVRGWADISKSIELNGMGGGSFSDINLLSAIDRHRESDSRGFNRLADAILKAAKYNNTARTRWS
jgi:TP901 family phage tail tape measure protein